MNISMYVYVCVRARKCVFYVVLVVHIKHDI